jgi:tripartite-type tricarboxylate transporter receptor subunit TctC
MIIDMPALAPFVKNGKLRGIAITAEKRTALLPEIPTSGEQGMPGLIAVNWFAIMAPARTPAPIIEKLYAALVKAATAPDMKEQFDKVGVDAYLHPSPEAFTSFLRQELTRWGKIAKDAGAKAD